jgi:integrase
LSTNTEIRSRDTDLEARFSRKTEQSGLRPAWFRAKTSQIEWARVASIPRVVMETLGHSQISLTMNTYSHVLPAVQREAADRMEAILQPMTLIST